MAQKDIFDKAREHFNNAAMDGLSFVLSGAIAVFHGANAYFVEDSQQSLYLGIAAAAWTGISASGLYLSIKEHGKGIIAAQRASSGIAEPSSNQTGHVGTLNPRL